MAESSSARPGSRGPTVARPVTHQERVVRRVSMLMTAVAVTLAAASALHLSGIVHGRTRPFDGKHAGIAEALIGAVLLTGAIAMVRATRQARMWGVGAIGFATLGFLVGLNFTARGGHWPDIAYHVTILPVLVGSIAVLVKTTGPSRP